MISKHRFFETPSRERIFRYVMNACRRTPEGKPRGFESSEKKACLSIQSELNKYEQRDRERMCEYVLSTYFGLSMEAVPELTLWQKTNIIGVLQSHLNLHTSFIVQFIQKAAEDAKLRQTALWNVADVDKAPGHSLAQLRLEDVVKTPGRWKDFVSSTPEVGTNRRQLMNALRERYHEPLRQKRGEVGFMQMLYEADDRLWDVEVLVTPIEVKVPSEIEQMHTSLLVHAFERLETLRLFAKEGSKVAKEFYLKCRESAPTAGKKYTELVEKAKERARAQQKDSLESLKLKRFKDIVHQPAILRGPAFTNYATKGAPPHPQRSSSAPTQRGVFRSRGGAKGYR